MANDLDDAENAIRNHSGFDNDDIGALLGRLVRVARAAIRRLVAIEARLDALEATTVSASQAAVDETPVDETPDGPIT